MWMPEADGRCLHFSEAGSLTEPTLTDAARPAGQQAQGPSCFYLPVLGLQRPLPSFLIFENNLHLLIVCVGGAAHTWRSGDNSKTLVLFFYLIGSWDLTQGFRL